MESIVKVPSNAGDMDFLAFSFNGKHSWDDFGIIRTSDGDRYNENLVPAMQDKTAEVPGGDGMYYFGTTHKQRDFNINIAFDNMSEEKFRKMRQWLSGKEMGDLWFSEAPYKVYTVKSTGTPSLKTLCFDEYNEKTGRNERVYKGEGTIQFTAYWPYAHTPDWVERDMTIAEPEDTYYFKKPIKIQTFEISGFVYPSVGKRAVDFSFIMANDATEIQIEFTKDQAVTFDAEIEVVGFRIYSDLTQNFYLYVINNDVKTLIPQSFSGKLDTSYEGFDNEYLWRNTAKLPNNTRVCQGENPGDIPAPFTLICSDEEEFTEGDDLKVGELKIKLCVSGKGLRWDSKTGIVSALVTSEGITERKPIPYTGNSLGTIPVGGLDDSEIVLDYGTLKYHYWYY